MSKNSLLSIFVIIIFTINGYSQRIFETTIPNGASDVDEGKEFVETPNHNYYVVGKINVIYMLLFKTDVLGNIIWEKEMMSLGLSGRATSIRYTNDNHLIVSGYKNSPTSGNLIDIFLMKIDTNGNEIWTKYYGTPNNDYTNSFETTSDGGYIISGTRFGGGIGESDILLIKTDSNGDSLWTKTYADSNYYESCQAVIQTSDSGYLLAGNKEQKNWSSSGRMYIIKTDNNGDTLWTKTSYLWEGDNAIGNSVCESPDSGIVVTGGYRIYDLIAHSENDLTKVMKFDKNGNVIWEKSFHRGYDSGVGLKINNLSNENFLVTEKGIITEIDNNGQVISENQYTFLDGTFTNYLFNFAKESSDSSLVITGTKNKDPLLLKIRENLSQTNPKELNISIYPNPTSSTFNIAAGYTKINQVSIISLTGIVLKKIDYPKPQISLQISPTNTYSIKIDYNISVADLAQGIYYVNISTPTKSAIHRLVKN